MLEFEFNTHVETEVLVDFFARCGWRDDEAGPKLEWALANSDDWVLCRLDGELVGFGRSCRLGPLHRIVFDVLVDSRFRGHGLRAEIVRLLSLDAGGLEKVSVFSGREDPMRWQPAAGEEDAEADELPWAPPNAYLGRKRSDTGGES